MAYDGALFVEDDSQILLARFAEYVRPYPAKKLARLIGCTEKTAHNFREGVSWPNARHWKLIARQFGRDVLQAVFEPEINETVARLRREERELRERLHEIEARRIKAVGGLDSPEERDDAPSYRSEIDRDLFDEARP